MNDRIPIPSPLYTLPGSVFLIVTGQTNNGKSYQMMRALGARSPEDGLPAVAPALVLFFEASGEGTMGELVADSTMCLVWTVQSCDEAREVLRRVFPEGRAPLSLAEAKALRHADESAKAAAAKMPPPPPPDAGPLDAWPIRSVGVDSASSGLRAQKAAIRDRARAERLAKDKSKGVAPGPSTSGKDLENDQKRIAALATGPAQNLVDALKGLTQRHRGLAVVVACHTRPLIETLVVGEPPNVEKVERAIGEAPDFGAPKSVVAGIAATGYADLWQALAQSAGVIWHCYATTPNYASMQPDKINSAEHGTLFGAVTERGPYPRLGPVMWPKRQAGEGWLGMFDAAPRLWHPDVPWDGADDFAARVRDLPSASTWAGGPDLGIMLELCLDEHRRRRS